MGLPAFTDFHACGITFRMAIIPPGSFSMGEGQSLQPHRNRSKNFSGRPHKVTLTSAFMFSESAVSQELWTAIMGANPSFFKGPGKPVENISWHEAVSFLSQLSLQAGYPFRLPTEAEWEYVTGLGLPPNFREMIGRYAWYADNSGGRTHDLCSKLPDHLGLYDMMGNVYHWCADWYGDYPGGHVVDPSGPAAGRERVYRGASWATQSLWLRPTFRLHARDDYRSNTLGLRLAADADQ